jgi:hypothetical protein
LALLCLGTAAPQTSTPAPSRPSARDATAIKAPRAESLPGEILLTAPAHCLDAEPRRTQGNPVRSQRLDQLPPGNLSLTVMRQVNGCPQPTTVREGYGAPGFRN